MKQLADEAIVLKRLDYGEADRILTVLTRTSGKISLIAKGVRKPKSRLAGGIELFTVNNVTYIDGKSDLKTLVSAHVSEHYSAITANLQTVQAAYDVLKYVHLYTESMCEDDYYQLCHSALMALNVGMPASIVFVWFAVHMLQVSGHGMNLDSDSQGMALTAAANYSFDYATMAFNTDPYGMYTANHIKVLRLCLSASLKKVGMVQNIQQLCDDMRVFAAECLKYNRQENLKS
jgi:DNA repair protein RecO (recombination protein O)